MSEEARRVVGTIVKGIIDLNTNQQYFLLGYMEGLKNAKVGAENDNNKP